MKIKLSNHYWSGKFSMGVETDTPLGDNLTELPIYEQISKEKFDEYVGLFENEDCYNVIREDDGKNIILIITERFKT